jgi:YVTN family beta-propeller protein
VTRIKLCRTLTWGLLVIVSAVTCKHSNSEPSDDVGLELSTSGDGTGHISNDVTLGQCPLICSFSFDEGQTITLTATPDPGSVFAGWAGDCVGSSPAVTLTLGTDAACDARFDLEGSQVQLTVSIEEISGASGKVIGQGIDCGDGGTDCTESYPTNTSVHLEVSYANAYTFKGWKLDCATFTSAAEIDLLMDTDKNCEASFDVADNGGLQPLGSFSFAYRVEAGVLLNNKVIVAGYDSPFGEIIDVSNPNALTSPAGADFSTCGARGLSTFFSHLPQYNSDIVFATCTDSRQGSSTLASGGFTQILFFNYAPGKSLHYKDDWVAITDFEFGRLRLLDYAESPQPPGSIDLTPGERSCPFDLTIHGEYAYVTGREGLAGTPTANCNNWSGIWKVNLTLGSMVNFAKFGTKLRDVEYGADDRLYASDFEEDKVHVINAATMTVERSISVGDGPVGIKLNPNATGMWVTNWNSNKIQYWNLTNDTLVDEEDSGGVHPVDVFVSGIYGYVLNFGDAGASIGGSVRAFQY